MINGHHDELVVSTLPRDPEGLPFVVQFPGWGKQSLPAQRPSRLYPEDFVLRYALA